MKAARKKVVSSNSKTEELDTLRWLTELVRLTRQILTIIDRGAIPGNVSDEETVTMYAEYVRLCEERRRLNVKDCGFVDIPDSRREWFDALIVSYSDMVRGNLSNCQQVAKKIYAKLEAERSYWKNKTYKTSRKKEAPKEISGETPVYIDDVCLAMCMHAGWI